ncbi:hypothetical protein [Bernardetia sp. MNP-M8]|uniref:hypothetical protein n=1 Tax=Bernardetia sp. MNP-M8 TaxID=3127470 RepID=UPI0030D60A33
MKKYFLIAIFFLVSLSAFAQNFDSLISKTEKEQFLSQKNEILMLLFDGIEISNKHDLEEVKWKPNFYESKQNVISDEDFAYTHLDTVFFYQEGNIKKAVVIFATYMYEKNRAIDCHFCAPTISVATFEYDEKLKKWQVNKFDKFYGTHGLYGKIQTIVLKKIGKEKIALFFYAGFTHMGENYSCTTIYDLSKFEKLKTVKTHYENLGSHPESEKEKWIKTSKEIIFDTTQINSNGYYDLIITTINKNSTKVEVFEYRNLEGYVLKE